MDANPVLRGHKEVPRSTGHIMATTRYSDQQRSKSRQKVCDSTNNGTDQYQNGSSNLFTPYREQPRSTRIVVGCRLPTTSVFSNKGDKLRSKCLKATHRTKIRKNKIRRSMLHGGGGLQLVKMCPRWASFSNRPPKHKHTLTDNRRPKHKHTPTDNSYSRPRSLTMSSALN